MLGVYTVMRRYADESRDRDNENQSSQAVLFCGNVYCALQGS